MPFDVIHPPRPRARRPGPEGFGSFARVEGLRRKETNMRGEARP